VCRECYRLGLAELAYRQAVRNIDRVLRFGVTIPRRQRPFVESLLTHRDPRIRAYATEVVARDREERAELLQLVREGEARFEATPVDPPPDDVNRYASDELVDDAEDIPF
jgi:hypothetical protein